MYCTIATQLSMFEWSKHLLCTAPVTVNVRNVSDTQGANVSFTTVRV